MSKVKAPLERCRLTLPRGDRHLLLKLSSFRYDLSPGGALRLHREHDDRVDALALAVSAGWSRGHRKSRVGSIPWARPPWG